MLAARTYLSPRIQEAILGGESDLGFLALLRLARIDGWKEWEAQARSIKLGERHWGRTSRMVNAHPENPAESRPNPSREGGGQIQKGGRRRRKLGQENAS